MYCIEPSVMEIFALPPYTDLVLIEDGENRYYCDAETQEPLVKYCPDK